MARARSEIRLAAELAGLEYMTVYMRMRKGMTLEEAVSHPVGRPLSHGKKAEDTGERKDEPQAVPEAECRPSCEVPPVSHDERIRDQPIRDRNKPQLIKADASWLVVRNCIRSLEHQVKMFERIIALIKEDPDGRRIYDRAMREMVEGGK